jgi:Fe-S oxidoreductase
MNIGAFIKRISLMFKNVLYYPGCLTTFVLPKIRENYISILKWMGQEHITIKELYCCGSPVRAAGYLDDFATLVKEHKQLLEKYGVGKVVFNCPSCYSTFKRFYPEVEAIHITQLLAKPHILSKIKPIYQNIKVTFHDPCHLGRYEGVYEEPRSIIKALGFEIVEMKNNRERARCCGAGGGLRNNYKEIAQAIGKERIKEAIETGAELLLTCCPLCYLHLKECAGKRIEVKELSEVVINAIKG